MIDPQKTAFTNLLAIAFSGMMIYHSTLEYHVIACKIPLLARAFGMRAEPGHGRNHSEALINEEGGKGAEC